MSDTSDTTAPTLAGDVIPSDLAALAEHGLAEIERHRERCEEPFCDRCERYRCAGRECTELVHVEGALCQSCSRERRKHQGIGAIPAAHVDASFASGWLIELVGRRTIAEASTCVGCPRLAIRGPAGAGKTSLVAAMLRARLESVADGGSIVWLSSHELAHARARYKLGDGEPREVVQAIHAGLLVLDDLGAEMEALRNPIPEVIYERHAHRRATWITTGLTGEQIGERYGGGVSRRVKDGAKTFVLGGNAGGTP